jgi:hypothetical protein
MRSGARLGALGACFGVSLVAGLAGCRNESAADAPAPASAPATPDRLGKGERLPEAETAFGLALPAGMRVVRHFNDSAYFAGDLGFDAVLEHVRHHVRTEHAQMQSRGIVFPRARALGGDPSRLLRIELSKTPRGTQLYIKDITPPPALSGLSEAEIWRKAGRKPDGTPLDPNQVY